MKKLLVFTLLLGCSCGAMASTTKHGLYIALKTGAALNQIEADMIEDDKAKLAGGIAFGVRSRNIRAELEYLWATSYKYKERYNELSQEIHTLMVQGYYDLPFKTTVRPFFNVGVGVALADVTYNGETENSYDFAYNIGGGFSLTLTPRSNIDIGYRWVQLKDITVNGIDVKNRFHQLYFGWRYVF